MVMDKNKPLPPHTKLDYWECYAKIVLEELLPEKFTNLILADKPDLQDNDGCVGVEVTIADNQKQLEAERLYSTLYYKNEKQKAYAIERIEKLGAKVHDGFMMGIKGSDDFERINNAIKTKCETIAKGGYESFDEYHLFMFSSIYAVDYMLQEELQYLIAEDIGKFYRMIYVLIPGGMYCFDLTTNEYKVFDIDSNMQHKQATKARQMVEEGEEMQQGYKQTEVGVIPDDWNLMPSGEFIEVLTDFTANGSFASLAENVTYLDYPDFARLVRLTDIRTNFKNQGVYVSKDSYEFLAKSSLFGGELLLANVGAYAGYSFLFQKNFQEYATLGPNMFLIKANKNILREEYVPLVFGYGTVFKQLIDAAASSAQPKINKENVRKSVAIIPPLEEQKRIAEVLYDVDSMISSLEKLISKKKAVKNGAMQELLTGKKRLPGFTGEWERINLSKKSKIKARIGWQGLTTNEYLDSGYAYLITGTDFVNGKIDWDNCHYVAQDRFDQDKNIQIQNNDILITKDGSLGKTALVKGLNKPATLNSGVFVIRPIQESYDSTFVYYILSSFVFKDFLDHLSAGSTIIHLYQKDISKFEFLMPPTIEEQAAIASILSDTDNEIEAMEQKLAKTRQIKQGMMQQLLTGKIRLT